MKFFNQYRALFKSSGFFQVWLLIQTNKHFMKFQVMTHKLFGCQAISNFPILNPPHLDEA